MLENVPWAILIAAALFMCFAPLGHTPHLVEKLRMLYNGTLNKPIDIFDLFLHVSPLILIAVKAWGEYVK